LVPWKSMYGLWKLEVDCEAINQHTVATVHPEQRISSRGPEKSSTGSREQDNHGDSGSIKILRQDFGCS
jgi:hypothetical protein